MCAAATRGTSSREASRNERSPGTASIAGIPASQNRASTGCSNRGSLLAGRQCRRIASGRWCLAIRPAGTGRHVLLSTSGAAGSGVDRGLPAHGRNRRPDPPAYHPRSSCAGTRTGPGKVRNGSRPSVTRRWARPADGSLARSLATVPSASISPAPSSVAPTHPTAARSGPGQSTISWCSPSSRISGFAPAIRQWI